MYSLSIRLREGSKSFTFRAPTEAELQQWTLAIGYFVQRHKATNWAAVIPRIPFFWKVREPVGIEG
jgi:hypothetical protein